MEITDGFLGGQSENERDGKTRQLTPPPGPAFGSVLCAMISSASWTKSLHFTAQQNWVVILCRLFAFHISPVHLMVVCLLSFGCPERFASTTCKSLRAYINVSLASLLRGIVGLLSTRDPLLREVLIYYRTSARFRSEIQGWWLFLTLESKHLRKNAQGWGNKITLPKRTICAIFKPM